MRMIPTLIVLLGCNPDIATTDTGKNPPGKDTADTSADSDTGSTDTDTAITDDFCGVIEIFDAECVMCHSASNPQGDLDLQTDPYAAIVNQPSAQYSGKTLVVPNDSGSSFLYLKMTANQGPNGDEMPTTGILDASLTDVVKTWINNGASSECGTIDTSDTDTGPTTYHPPGWDDSSEHGIGAKFRTDDCQGCHGSDLSGGSSGVSCDDCHDSGWRNNCTFCHGGTDNNTGAPPEDIDDSTSGLSFDAHTSHVSSSKHPDYDCVQCHTKPSDVLSDGHLFNADSTKGVSEVIFKAGLSDVGTYAGAGSCSNLYCHGDGDGKNGSAKDGNTYGCTDCHGGMADGGRGLGGKHDDHLEEGVSCEDCHSSTVSSGTTISGPDNHVNGKVDVALPSGMTYSGGECTGNCHGENHNGRNW